MFEFIYYLFTLYLFNIFRYSPIWDIFKANTFTTKRQGEGFGRHSVLALFKVLPLHLSDMTEGTREMKLVPGIEPSFL